MGMGSYEVLQYVNSFDEDVRKRLELMRALVARTAPESDESFSYGLVAYKLNGKPLVYFGAFKDHIGFYATPNGHAQFAEAFAPYKQGKGSVQFPLSRPLPIDLIKQVILFRKQTIEGK